MLDGVLEWDRDLLVFLNTAGSETYDAFWQWATVAVNWVPLFLVLLILIYRKLGAKSLVGLLLVLAFCMLFTATCTDLVKLTFARLRPVNDSNIRPLLRVIRGSSSYSFFSGHAANSFAATTLLYLMLRKKMVWIGAFFIWPMIFSYSRLYLGLHFPTDILVGALFGVLAAGLCYLVYSLTSLFKAFKVPYSK
jgi:undecaprenyl-diphosphatase